MAIASQTAGGTETTEQKQKGRKREGGREKTSEEEEWEKGIGRCDRMRRHEGGTQETY